MTSPQADGRRDTSIRAPSQNTSDSCTLSADDFSDVFDAIRGYEDGELPADDYDDDWALDPNMEDQ